MSGGGAEDGGAGIGPASASAPRGGSLRQRAKDDSKVCSVTGLPSGLLPVDTTPSVGAVAAREKHSRSSGDGDACERGRDPRPSGVSSGVDRDGPASIGLRRLSLEELLAGLCATEGDTAEDEERLSLNDSSWRRQTSSNCSQPRSGRAAAARPSAREEVKSLPWASSTTGSRTMPARSGV